MCQVEGVKGESAHSAVGMNICPGLAWIGSLGSGGVQSLFYLEQRMEHLIR